MKGRPEKEEVIFYNGTLYRRDDIVTIKTTGTYGREHTGRISGIDTSCFWLDMSKEYHEDIRRFEYDDIDYIKYAAETDSESQQGGQA